MYVMNWWVEPNFGIHETAKLPKFHNWQNVIRDILVLSTRKEYIGFVLPLLLVVLFGLFV